MEKAQRSLIKLRAEVLAKIDLLERTAWEAFLNSQGELVVNTNRGKTNPKTVIMEVMKQEVRRISSGDPRFLEVIGGCFDARIQLLGLAQPNNGENYDHLTVIGFEVVADTKENEKNEMNEKCQG